jgi:hypothetical protein
LPATIAATGDTTTWSSKSGERRQESSKGPPGWRLKKRRARRLERPPNRPKITVASQVHHVLISREQLRFPLRVAWVVDYSVDQLLRLGTMPTRKKKSDNASATTQAIATN